VDEAISLQVAEVAGRRVARPEDVELAPHAGRVVVHERHARDRGERRAETGRLHAEAAGRVSDESERLVAKWVAEPLGDDPRYEHARETVPPRAIDGRQLPRDQGAQPRSRLHEIFEGLHVHRSGAPKQAGCKERGRCGQALGPDGCRHHVGRRDLTRHGVGVGAMDRAETVDHELLDTASLDQPHAVVPDPLQVLHDNGVATHEDEVEPSRAQGRADEPAADPTGAHDDCPHVKTTPLAELSTAVPSRVRRAAAKM
jgi:hypothetical protein